MLNLDKNKKYLLACSYGPDSMALFDMLYKEGYNFTAAMVNYHLRDEAFEEMKNFQYYAEQLKVPYRAKEIFAWENKSNLEEKCRQIRYEWFAQLIQREDFDCLLVAHNQDDHLETYIMQKNRKNLPIFYGIKENTEIFGVKVTRPLLAYKKSDLRKYCDDNHVPYAIDSSNLTDDFERNKVRHHIVSKMSDEDREKMVEEINYRNKVIEHIFNKLSQLDLSSCEDLSTLSEGELAYALNLEIRKYKPDAELSMRFIRELKKVIESKKANILIPIDKSLFIQKSYDRFEFRYMSPISYSYTLAKPGKLDTEYFYLDFTNGAEDRNIKDDDYPLLIRNAKNGDHYKIKDYYVDVRRLFIDWKMPINLRSRWPIIFNRFGEVVYIPRYRKNFEITKSNNFYVK